MNFYAINVIYALYGLYVYLLFRLYIGDYLRYNKNSKTFINKNKKGWRNYWFYEKLHRETDLQWRYGFNAVLLFLTAGYFILAVCLGWAEPVQLPIALLSFFTAALQIPTVILSYIYTNLNEYGRKFVLFAGYKKSGSAIRRSPIDLLALVIPLFFALWNFHHIFGTFGN